MAGPYFNSRLSSLPKDGVLMYAGMLYPDTYPNPPSHSFPDRQLPLQISDAEIQRHWEGQPVNNVPQYILPARVDSQYVVVFIYFGNQNPSQSQLTAAQQQLDTLAIPKRQPSAHRGRSSFPAPSFHSASGWYTASSGPISPGADGILPNAPMAWAANIPLPAHQAVRGYPTSTLASLPVNGVAITVTLDTRRSPVKPDANFPTTSLPLDLSRATYQPVWEGQVAPNVPEYILLGTVKQQYVDVRIFFGTQKPAASVLLDAQRELANLVIPDRPKSHQRPQPLQ
jgi:hypothetical protein